MRFDRTMAWLIAPSIRHLDTPFHTITWHHAMTTTLSRSDHINHPTAGATRATMPGMEIRTGVIVIAVGDDTKSTFFSSARELAPQGPSTA